jgi:hypothetical protein
VLREALVVACAVALWVAANSSWDACGDTFSACGSTTELPAAGLMVLVIVGQWGCLVGASSPVVRGQAAVVVRASGGQCVCPLVSRVPATLRTLRADCAPPEVDSHQS